MIRNKFCEESYKTFIHTYEELFVLGIFMKISNKICIGRIETEKYRKNKKLHFFSKTR